MPTVHSNSLIPLLVLSIALTASGQWLPDPSPKARDVAALRKMSATAFEAGERALERKDVDAAYHHFVRALRHDPWHQDALQELLVVAAKDPDARALWAHAWWAAEADANGKARPNRALKKLLPPDDPHLAKLSLTRAAAVKELADWIAATRRIRQPIDGGHLSGRFAAGVAQELARPSLALIKKHGKAINTGFRPYPHDTKFLVSALQALMTNALGKGEIGVAVRAARCLYGLASQGAFKDLKGQKPTGLTSAREQAGRTLEQARRTQRERIGEPLTVEKMENMTEEERERFTREHAGFDNPGVCLSPEGLYRVETTCGFETLLGVAKTVERHHRRLARWYGKDPFVGRQGTVRVVPEHSGLEAEGTPYWWAGGFQRGDVTTVRFAVGNIEGLGGTLTHELTHRFDGAIYPMMPSWLVEGRAVWTGGAYGHSSDREFTKNFCNFGTIENAMHKGYGSRENLTKLIEGTIDDYRDNYVAGYALYVYLATWEEAGTLVFRDRLERYMKEMRKGRSKPMKWFTTNFCDGKRGRPEDLDAFVDGWRAFLRGFHWRDRAAWVSRYTTRNKTARGAPWVYDGPTWVRTRNRAEPYFGQDQARLAGDLFFEVGQKADAARAWLWALGVDDWPLDVAEKAAPLLDELRKPDTAWLVRAETARRLRWVRRDASPGPWRQLAKMPKLRAWLEASAEAADDYRSRGWARAAASIAIQRDLVARSLGLEPLPDPKPDAGFDKLRHPFDEPERALWTWGWTEDELTGHDEHRVKDLWYATSDDKLHVGRFKPREGTGELDRAAHMRHSFVRGNVWVRAGRYRLETRVFFTTTFVSGAVVLGWGRRDRNVRFDFTAGDFLYSTGVTQEQTRIEGVRWGLVGLRDRDPGLWGSAPRGNFAFEHPKTSFVLELLVDGPEVHARIDGKPAGSYHTLDGLPIEGFVGFATSRGAFRVDEPIVQRLDRTAEVDATPGWPRGLDVAWDTKERGSILHNRGTRGFPLAKHGTVVLWIPPMSQVMEESFDPSFTAALARRAVDFLVPAFQDRGYPQPVVVAVPERLGEEQTKLLADGLAGQAKVITHRRAQGLNDQVTRDEHPDANLPSVLFVDPVGCLRALHPLIPGMRDVGPVEHWLKVFAARAKL